MGFENIVFGIGTLIGILLFRQTKPILLKIILTGLALCVGLSYLNGFIDINIPFFSFGVLTFGFIIWCGIKVKWVSLIIGFFAFLSFIWSFMNLQYWGQIQFSMIIPISCYIWVLYKKRNFKKEISILTSLVSFELSEFILWLSRLFN